MRVRLLFLPLPFLESFPFPLLVPLELLLFCFCGFLLLPWIHGRILLHPSQRTGSVELRVRSYTLNKFSSCLSNCACVPAGSALRSLEHKLVRTSLEMRFRECASEPNARRNNWRNFRNGNRDNHEGFQCCWQPRSEYDHHWFATELPMIVSIQSLTSWICDLLLSTGTSQQSSKTRQEMS